VQNAREFPFRSPSSCIDKSPAGGKRNRLEAYGSEELIAMLTTTNGEPLDVTAAAVTILALGRELAGDLSDAVNTWLELDRTLSVSTGVLAARRARLNALAAALLSLDSTPPDPG
jgi:hypothetical protein